MNSTNIFDRKEPLQRIGFYDIERTIGKGNFAVVRLARHRITKSYVALKVINKTKLDEANLKKMYREIRIMQLINHQHIVKLYQVIETKTLLFLVTEYAPNGELFDYVSKHGRMSEANAKSVFAQIGIAVKYLHDNKIVHRDLKTENVLFDATNRVKLADFGFANFYADDGMLSTWCGSPPYAAPEVFEGLKYHGPEIDIWSLGVILYVLVCGILPFSGDTLQSLRDHVLSCHFRVPYFLSTICEDLIRKMLIRNPSKRLAIADVLRHQWFNGVSITDVNDTIAPISLQQQELVLGEMQRLGIPPARVLQSIEKNAFDNYASMYHLLAEQYSGQRRPFEGLIRRPSSLAEQAIEQATGNRETNSNMNNHLLQSPNSTQSHSGSDIDKATAGNTKTNASFKKAVVEKGSLPPRPQTGLSNTRAIEAAIASVTQQQRQQQSPQPFTAQNKDMKMPHLNLNGARMSLTDMMPLAQNLQSAFSAVSSGNGNNVPQVQLEQPLFTTPAMSLQHQHQHVSATSVPGQAAAAQAALASLHPFICMNGSLLPSSYYGNLVMQQIQMQQQQQQQLQQHQGMSLNSSDAAMDTSMAQFTQNPSHPPTYRTASDLRPTAEALAEIERQLNNGNHSCVKNGPSTTFVNTGKPPSGPCKRPPLLKRASLPANVGGQNVFGAVMLSDKSLDSQSSSYTQHPYVAKSNRRTHATTKVSPYPLPTQVELPSPADSNNGQQRFLYNMSDSGSTSQLQVATELLTIHEQNPAQIAVSFDERVQNFLQSSSTQGVIQADARHRSIDVPFDVQQHQQ